MANYSAKIANNAISGLAAQQALLAVTSNNIANVNTPGYSRRIGVLQTRSSAEDGLTGGLGSGVSLDSVTRMADDFLQRSLLTAKGEKGSAQIQSDFLKRLDKLFPLDGKTSTIGSSLNKFFASANDLAGNPASIELRSNFLSTTNELVSTIRSTFNQIASMQNEADKRLDNEVASINSLTTQIAALNVAVSSRETNGGQGVNANDERDQRDALLEQLSQKISFSTVELADGSINVTLSSGFPLVSGANSRNLAVTDNPTFDATIPSSLSGPPLRYIVYDFGTAAAPSHIDLTSVIGSGQGSLGGALQIRGLVDPTDTNAFEATGPLVEVASQIEAITKTLLTTINQYYRGYDPSLAANGDEDSGTAGFQASSGNLNGTSPGVYGLFTFSGALDVDADGLPDDLAALNINNFSSLLSVAITDPRDVAASRDSNAVAAATTFLSGDGRNMASLANLRTTTMTFSAGSFTMTGSFEDAYANVITTVGNKASVANGNLVAATQKELTVVSQREEISGVSLDEEFSNLVKFQRAYQASAKVLKISDDLMQQIIGILG